MAMSSFSPLAFGTCRATSNEQIMGGAQCWFAIDDGRNDPRFIPMAPGSIRTGRLSYQLRG